jgi:hypothetical protein
VIGSEAGCEAEESLSRAPLKILKRPLAEQDLAECCLYLLRRSERVP